MILDILRMIGLTFLQNASFTLVSRARNSRSLKYHAVAALFSNGIWILVIREVVLNLDKPLMMGAYIIGSLSGSLIMHHIAMKYFEKEKTKSKN